MKKVVKPIEVKAEETHSVKTVEEFDLFVEKDKQGLTKITSFKFFFREPLITLYDVVETIEYLFEPSYLKRIGYNDSLVEEITDALSRAIQGLTAPRPKEFNWSDEEEGERTKFLKTCRPWFDGRTECSFVVETSPEKLLKYHQDMAEYLNFVKNNK